MKSHIILPFILLSAGTAFSQNGTTGVAMRQEFAELAAHGGLSGQGFAAFQTYSSTQTEGSQFFFPDWADGEVITIRKEAYNAGLQFVYDKVRQELFIRKKDSALILLANKDEIQSFSLKNEDGNQFNFVNSKLFTDDRPEVFYQVLVYDSLALTLLKYINTALVKADLTDMMKQRMGEVYDAFVDKYFYFIFKNGGGLNPVQLKTKSLKKTFADLNMDPEKYLKDNPGIINEDYLINLVKFFNSQPVIKN
jgi:hypothetical protein